MSPHGQIGPFEVLERLGAGGMGEVFKARDTRLNRFVALKFLPAAATDAARERFQREAMAIAALSHPHICTLYEIGEDHGRPYLVLELLEGETLRLRLACGPVPPEQVLDWGVQIADALDAAHRRGVLHRDLKPDNVWVSPGGHIKVLDFGLARLEADAGFGETLATPVPLTSPGVAMGTYPYMSPEQAKGEPLDARSDIFTFGSVFYEMATGRHAFAAANAADLIAAILKEHPKPLRQLRPELPPLFGQVAERCLEKEPDLRYQSAADLRGELKRLKRESGSAAAASAVSPSAPAPAPRSDTQIFTGMLRRHWRWQAAAAAVIAAGILAWWRLGPRPVPPPPQLQFRQLTFNGHVVDAVISPDGKFLAHADVGPQGTSLRLLSIASGSDVEIMPPAPGCCQSPSFSPDGGAVFFLEGGSLKSVPMLGGAVRTVVEPACSGAGFSPDGSQIAYLTTVRTLVVAQADGSQARVLHQLPGGDGYMSQCWNRTFKMPTHSPAWSPDGRWIAVAEFPASGEGHVSLVNPASGQARTLGPGLTITSADLNWLLDSSGLAMTASIPDTAASQVWEVANPSGRLAQLTNDLQGYSAASLSASGQLAVVHSLPQASIWVQARADGEFQQLPGGGANQDGAAGLAWTAQGGLLSLRNLGGKAQIWSENSDGSQGRALVLGRMPDAPSNLQVAPNGQIVFASNGAQASIWRVNGNGSGLTQLVQPPAGADAYAPSLVRDGREVAFTSVSAAGGQTLETVPLAGGTPRQAWTGYIYGGSGAASPDGSRVFVIARGATPGSQFAAIVRLDGGQPQSTPLTFDLKSVSGPTLWTPDGRAITFRRNQGTTDNLWAQPINAGKPYAITNFQDLKIGSYAWSRDGRLAVSRGSQNSDAAVATGLAGKGGGGH